jgi:putative ABC transport system permease protein
VSTNVAERQISLTGILPQSEFKAQSTWQSVSLFQKGKKTSGCAKPTCKPKELSSTPDSLATDRLIDQLSENQVVVGAELAKSLQLQPGKSLEIFGELFQILAVLPASGTIDDTRLFAHLHSVQRLAKTGDVVNAIEIIGCCEDVSEELAPQLSALLPESRVVTISQVVQAQVGVNQLMTRSSMFVLAVLVLVGGATVASAISANVRERRREIGTLMALGATSRFVSAIFLLKASFVGMVGGLAGALTGAGMAVYLGPAWAGVTVTPMLGLTTLAVTSATAVTLAAAMFPTWNASRLDPCVCFREV